jgi:hypothetical protein
MRTLVAIFLLLPLAALAEEVRIAVGQSRDDVVALIQKHGATDITPGQEVVGPKGEWPLKGIYWAFRDYDAIISLTAKDGKITEMTFWTKKDFRESKSYRAKTEQSVTALTLDTKTRGVSIEKKKDAG